MMQLRRRNLRLSAKLALAALLLGVLAACGGTPPPGTVDRTLTVTVDGSGTGTVTSDVGGIDVTSGEAAVSVELEEGTEVELTAVAEAGSTFTGWTGCTGTDTCVVVLDANTSVTATFTADAVEEPQPLTVTIIGAGEGTVTSDVGGVDLTSGDDPVVVDIDAGTEVTLTATAADVDSVFAGWSGACTGLGTCVVTMDAATSVTADFVLASGAIPANFVIAAESDDAEEYGAFIDETFIAGSVHVDSNDLDIGRSETLGVSTVVGLRYAGVDIPQGAVILSASITFTRSATSGAEPVTFTIAGQDADDSTTFVDIRDAGATFGISERPRTTATVDWSSATAWGATATSPDLSTIVQEIVDRDGWAADNALVFVIDSDDDTPGASRRAISADTVAGIPPSLSVTYILPTAP